MNVYLLDTGTKGANAQQILVESPEALNSKPKTLTGSFEQVKGGGYKLSVLSSNQTPPAVEAAKGTK